MKLFFFYHCFFFHYHFSSCSTLEEKCYSLKCFHTNTFSVNQCSKLNRKTLQFIYLLWLVSPTRGRINHIKTRRLRALFLAIIEYICINHEIYLLFVILQLSNCCQTINNYNSYNLEVASTRAICRKFHLFNFILSIIWYINQ